MCSIVGHGRWWSLTCGDECCPLAGTPLDLTSHPLAAAAVLAGLVTRANREELEASIGGPSPAELPRLQSITETLFQRDRAARRGRSSGTRHAEHAGYRGGGPEFAR
mgnify:CR=1 FL=1